MRITYVPAGTQRPMDVPWRSPKGPNVQDLKETFRELSGEQRKTNDLMKKLFFRCSSPCITDIFLFFTGKANIQSF